MLPTQFGASIRPLGPVKIKLIKLLAGLISLYSRRINKAIVDSKLFMKIMVNIF